MVLFVTTHHPHTNTTSATSWYYLVLHTSVWVLIGLVHFGTPHYPHTNNIIIPLLLLLGIIWYFIILFLVAFYSVWYILVLLANLHTKSPTMHAVMSHHCCSITANNDYIVESCRWHVKLMLAQYCTPRNDVQSIVWNHRAESLLVRFWWSIMVV